MQAIWPHFAPYKLPTLVKPEEIDFSTIDVVFGCLPHAASAELLSKVEGPRIVDLSADFRLTDPAVYAEWYGNAHPAPALLTEAVYGRSEEHTSELQSLMRISYAVFCLKKKKK